MQTRTLGRDGPKVSLICLGTMTWGRQNSEAEGHAQMDFALDRGVSFWDAAEMYPVPPTTETYGRTEEIIGSWLASRGRRGEIVLATKASGPGRQLEMEGPERRLDYVGLRRSVEKSLKRLRTDYIDLYQIHWPARPVNMFGQLGYAHRPSPADETPLEETTAALIRLVQDGLIRAYGFSNDTPWGMMRALMAAERLGGPRPASIQNPYSLLNRSFEVGLAEVAIREEMGLLAYSPLAMGQLSGKYENGARPPGARLTLFSGYTRYTSPRGLAATTAYVAIARRHGLDPAQMAIAYVAGRPFVTSVIIGASRLDQLEANIAAADLVLSDDVLREIEAVQADNPNPCP